MGASGRALTGGALLIHQDGVDFNALEPPALAALASLPAVAIVPVALAARRWTLVARDGGAVGPRPARVEAGSRRGAGVYALVVALGTNDLVRDVQAIV